MRRSCSSTTTAPVSPTTSRCPRAPRSRSSSPSSCRGRAADYLIRVNRQPVAEDHVLQDGDRVSFTPTKIEGAA